MGFPMLTAQRVTEKRLSNETRISLRFAASQLRPRNRNHFAAVSHLQLEATGARHK